VILFFYIVVLMPLVRKRTDHAGAANGSKRARIAPAYPCRVCKAECSYEQDCVQCDGCEAWMHTGCIRMNHDQYTVYGATTHLQFFCLQCSRDANGLVNFHASLRRIASLAPDIPRMQAQAQSEMALLSFYNVTLPSISLPSTDHANEHKQSVDLLEDRCHWLLTKFSPASVGGDGNCLFRSASMALFGCERHYMQLLN